ncbi:MAG: hypothetical protein PVH84_05575 [Candidatus Aminicenantes bacterium]|jgi:hypothetical protein
MKVKFVCILAIFFIFGLLPFQMNAQEPEKRYQMFWVIDEVVKPSMANEYYEAGKKWTALLTEHDYPAPFDVYWTYDNHVLWVTPIRNFGDIDKHIEAFNKMREKSPDAFKEAYDAFNGTYMSTRQCVYALDLKYSMIAKDAASKAEEAGFVFFDIYYFEPGKDEELEKIWDEMKAFMEDKEVIQSWYYYWGVMGTDNPVLLAAASAKNAIEFWEENAKMWKALGKEAGKFKQKMMKYVTKEETKMAWIQKELSYTPAKKEK